MKVKCIKAYDNPFYCNIKIGDILFCDKSKDFDAFIINGVYFSYGKFNKHFINIKNHRKQILDLI